jgi:hypothetical protein
MRITNATLLRQRQKQPFRPQIGKNVFNTIWGWTVEVTGDDKFGNLMLN